MAYPHKWSPISYKLSAGQRKHIGQRPMLYRWTTPPSSADQVAAIEAAYSWRCLSSRRRKTGCRCDAAIRQNWTPTPAWSGGKWTACSGKGRHSSRADVVTQSHRCFQLSALNTLLLVASTCPINSWHGEMRSCHKFQFIIRISLTAVLWKVLRDPSRILIFPLISNIFVIKVIIYSFRVLIICFYIYFSTDVLPLLCIFASIWILGQLRVLLSVALMSCSIFYCVLTVVEILCANK